MSCGGEGGAGSMLRCGLWSGSVQLIWCAPSWIARAKVCDSSKSNLAL